MKQLKEGDTQSNGQPYYISFETLSKIAGRPVLHTGLSISDVKQNKREWKLSINSLTDSKKGADLEMFLNKYFCIAK